MKKIKFFIIEFFIYINIIVATILGIYCQSLSYAINDKIEKISPLYWLTILTIISILLFLTNHILIHKYINMQEKERYVPYIYIGMNTLLGCLVSFVSALVLLIWWGV